MTADIPQRQRTQQGVAQGMHQHVAVRVGDRSAHMRHLHPAKDEALALSEPVYVVSVPDSYFSHCPLLKIVKKRGPRILFGFPSLLLFDRNHRFLIGFEAVGYDPVRRIVRITLFVRPESGIGGIFALGLRL